MRITIILEAQHIPEDCTVRKPTGVKTYLMRRQGIRVYSSHYASEPVTVYGAGTLHLTCADHIQMVGPEDKLALDFESVEATERFMEELPHGS